MRLGIGNNIQNILPVIGAGGGGVPTEALNFFTAIEGASGTLSTLYQDEFSALVTREKTAGRWSKLIRLYMYSGGTVASSVIDAVTLNSASAVNIVSGNIDPLIGITTDGSTSYVQDWQSGAAMLPNRNDMQWGFFQKGIPIVPYNYANGIHDNITPTNYMSMTRAGRVYSGGLSTNRANTSSIPDNNTILIGARYSNSLLKIYLVDDLVEQVGQYTTAVTFNTLDPADKWVVCGATLWGGVPAGFQDGTNLVDFIASGFTEADVLGFRTSMQTFLNNINAYA